MGLLELQMPWCNAVGESEAPIDVSVLFCLWPTLELSGGRDSALNFCGRRGSLSRSQPAIERYYKSSAAKTLLKPLYHSFGLNATLCSRVLSSPEASSPSPIGYPDMSTRTTRGDYGNDRTLYCIWSGFLFINYLVAQGYRQGDEISILRWLSGVVTWTIHREGV